MRCWLCALWPSSWEQRCLMSAAQTQVCSQRPRGRLASGLKANQWRSCWGRRDWLRTGSAGGWGSQCNCVQGLVVSGDMEMVHKVENHAGACRKKPLSHQGLEPATSYWISVWCEKSICQKYFHFHISFSLCSKK